MRRRLVVIVGAVCLAFALISILVVYFPALTNHHISKEGYDRLKVGMKYIEVEQILGAPPADYGPGHLGLGGNISGAVDRQEKWLASSFAIIVCFDENDRVTSFRSCVVHRDSFLQILRQKLRLE